MRYHEAERHTGDIFYSSLVSRSSGLAVHDDYEIFRVARGRCGCIVEGSEYELAAGDVIFILPGERHMTEAHGSDKCYGQLVRIGRGYLAHTIPDVTDAAAEKPAGEMNCIPVGIARKYGFDAIFEQLHGYALSDRRGAETSLRLCSLMLVSKIGEILRYEYSPGELPIKKNIKKITDYIAENISGTINLDGIANHLYLDKSYICRLFKHETGLTINNYINISRISLAKQLIAEGMSPRDAYTRCGYNDYSTFYRAFRRCAGIGPEEFRRSCEDD